MRAIREGAPRIALVCGTVAAVCLGVLVGHSRRAGLLSKHSTQYWSAYYADASPYPRYGSSVYTAYAPVGRRPAYYNSDVNVEEAIGLPNNIDEINFKTKEGKKAVAGLVDVVASLAFKKNIDKVKDEDRDKVEITDITPIPAVVTVSEIYPKERPEGVRVDFIVKAPNAHAADEMIGILSESKLTKGLQQAKILKGADEKKKIKAGTATILSVTTSAFATPMFDDQATWGLENATQNSAYQAYLKSFYRSASADRARWPWLDHHMIYRVLGGDNGYQYSGADAALDRGDAQGEEYGRRRTIAFDDLSGDLDDSDFYGSGGGLRHGDMRSSLLGDEDQDAAASDD